MFDSKEFAKHLAMEASQVVPPEFSKEDKDFVVELVHKFCLLCADALVKDEKYNLDENQIAIITQFIGEWTFHKSIDLINGGVQIELREGVLQKVAFTVFEIAKQAISRNMPQEQVLKVIENQVKNSFINALKDLNEHGKISDEVLKNTLKESNIDNVTKQEYEQECLEDELSDDKILELASLALFIKKLPSNIIKKILSNFPDNEARALEQYIKIPNLKDKISYETLIKVIFIFFRKIFNVVLLCTFAFLILMLITRLLLSMAKYTTKVVIPLVHLLFKPIIPFFNLHNTILLTTLIVLFCFCIYQIITRRAINKLSKELDNVKRKMQDLVNPNKMYERLGVDILSLQVGSGLLIIADPDQEGQLLVRLAALRHSLTDELGYIIPNFRIMDSAEIKDNEYLISIREGEVAKGVVYPSKFMVIADRWEASGKPVPFNTIASIDPVSQTQAYWIDPQYIEKDSKITAAESIDVIIKHLREILIQHVDEVMTKTDVLKLMELVKLQDPTLVNDLVPTIISASDLRKIFVNLIREKVSIKDIIFIFERLCDYARFSKEPDILSERLRAALGRQICMQNCNKDKVLYALTLSSEWEKTLDDSRESSELGTMFSLTPTQMQELVETTANTLLKAHQEAGVQPVILCSPRIRLPLYQMLERHIPTIVVISYAELIVDVKVETIGEIKYYIYPVD